MTSLNLPRSSDVLRRRTVVLAGLMALPFPLLVGRLHYLQNFAGARYRQLAEENRLQVRPIRPTRGDLLDRHGLVLATDRTAHRLVIVPEQCPNPQAVLARLGKLVPLDKNRQADVLATIRRRAPFTPVTVLPTLPFEDLARVQANLPDLPGLDLANVPMRTYEDGTLIGHIVGYVGRPDYEVPRGGRWSPDFPVGRHGMEKVLEDKLSGVPGLLQTEVNAHGRSVAEVSRQPARRGQDVRLSLDMRAQRAAWQALGDETGAVVALNVHTGGVLAAVGKPGFDPNAFTEGLDDANWQALLEDKENPLLNRAFQGSYSPGSTFKLVVALAALMEGVTDAKETVTCRGHVDYGDRRFHCWKKHGTVDMDKAIYGSCDIYFYEMARRLGVDRMAKYAHMFGLGHKTGLPLPEKTGLVPTRAWKQQEKGEAWSGGENLLTGIGQGFLLSTPVQMAVMTARIATGRAINPVLLRQDEVGPAAALPVDAHALEVVRTGMDHVVNIWGGTARSAKSEKVTMAGKTGTVQVISRRIEDDVPMSSVPRKQRPHGMFVAYGPVENPSVAVSVVVEHGGSGSGAAAPVAVKVLEAALKGVG